MKNQNTRWLYQYWLSRRGERTTPRRADINPTDIQHLLMDSFILQINSEAMATYRLAGSRIASLFGQELRQQPFLYLWAPIHRDTVESAIEIVVDEALCVVIGWRGRTNDGRRITGETLLMPLSLDSDERVERILGIASTHNAPFWLGQVPVAELDVTTLRVIDPRREERGGLSTGEVYVDPSSAASKQDENPQPIANVVHMHASRRVGHLAIFDGGRTD